MSYSLVGHLGDEAETHAMYGYLATMYCNWLHCELDEIVLHPDCEEEEMWETTDFEPSLTMSDVNNVIGKMHFGNVQLGLYKGKPAILEQAAAPIGIWINGVA